MRRNSFLIILLLIPALWFCTSARAAVTVQSGSVSLPVAGGMNDVWADPGAANTVFDRWIGDTSALADPMDWHTTTVIPNASAVVTASYKSASPWTATTHVMNGLAQGDPLAVELIYYFPANPLGVIFFFHGAGGSATGWFGDHAESLSFLRDAVALGYAVVALDSKDRLGRQWDNSDLESNIDVMNVQASINYLSGQGLTIANLPKFAVGMSNGGGFSPKPSYFLGFSACAIFCAPGEPATMFKTDSVPTIWCLAQNDDQLDHTSTLGPALAHLTSLNTQSPRIDGELRENVPSPVYPRRFLRIPGLTITDSQAIYDSLNNGGFLDSLGYLKTNPETSGWQSSMALKYTAYLPEILDQLDCCYTAHKFFGDFNHKVLQFFGAHRASFFDSSVALPNGVNYLEFANGTPFGYYSCLTDPNYIYHFDLGYLYVFDAGDNEKGVYFYDFTSGHFFYTSAKFSFPYLYDLTLNATLYYYPDSTNPQKYTSNPRYFFNFNTGKIFTQ